MSDALITIAVPSYNQGQFLNDTLTSIYQQAMDVEVFVLDGGSKDNSVELIKQWETRLTGWRSRPDEGQSAAINTGISLGSAPYVCWLNSDDFFYPNALKNLLNCLQAEPEKQFVYGRCWTVTSRGRRISPYLTLPFSPWLFANFCSIAQPATLITRAAWQQVGGLNENMHLAFDYDLWWRLFNEFGKPACHRGFVAATRMHRATKTGNLTDLHYQESIEVVKRHRGSVPLKWRVAKPIIKAIRKLRN